MNYKRPRTKCAFSPAAILFTDSFSARRSAPTDPLPAASKPPYLRSCRQDEEFYGFGDFFRDLDKELVRPRAPPARPRVNAARVPPAGNQVG